jgi:hypothetical protein
LCTFLVSHPCWLNNCQAGAFMVERLNDLCISSTYRCHQNIVMYFRSVAVDGVWIGYWIYWHNSELQVITVLLLIPTLYKSLRARSSPACSVSNSGDPWASHSQVVSSQPPIQNSTQLNCSVISCQPSMQNSLELPAWGPRYIALVPTLQKNPPPTGGCLVIAQRSLTCLPAATKKWMFLLVIIA